MSKVIILENINFQWEKEDINIVKKMWRKGANLKDIGITVKRDGVEVLMLLIELARKGHIKDRPGFLWGNNGELGYGGEENE